MAADRPQRKLAAILAASVVGYRFSSASVFADYAFYCFQTGPHTTPIGGSASMEDGCIDFWFTMGSTYSYLSVMRLEKLAAESGIRFRWRPFHLLLILQEMKHVPFADKPAKMSYMWRDLGRRAAMHGIETSLPAPYPPKQSVMANLVALIGMRQGWGEDWP
jgi:hypothetical protein